jgi:hypothetical protein
MKTIIVIAALAGLTAGAETGLAIQSAIVPGMGQMAAGRGEVARPNTLKGLAIMSGFVVCAHSAFRFASLQESYAEETQVRAREREEAEFYQDKVRIDEQWNAAYENYKNAQSLTLVFTGLAAAVYAYGIIDALLFTKPVKSGEGAFIPTRRTELRLARVGGVSGAEVLHRF